jgi:hypothetical protein
MKLAQFKNTTGTSMASARTSAALIGNVTPHRVRNERFVPERTVNQIVQEGNTKTQVINQVGNTVLGVMNGIATRKQALDAKVEEAEFRSQAASSVNNYQKSVAGIRNEQLLKPITETNKDGVRTILSDNFAEQYEQASSKASDEIHLAGLTNERAKAWFMDQRGKIDNSALESIYSLNRDAKVEVAKRDSLEVLQGAPTAGIIKSTINDMVETGLINPSDAPALEREHIQSLNTRKTINSLSMLNGNVDNTEISDQAFSDNLDVLYTTASNDYLGGDISLSQYKEISSKVKAVEGNRSVMIEQQREYNTLLFMQAMAQQQATGNGDPVGIARATLQNPEKIASMVDSMGVENAMGLMKTMANMAKGGSTDFVVEQSALHLVNRYRQTGSSEDYNAATTFMNENAGKLGNHTLRTTITTARNNNQSSRVKGLTSLIKATVSSKLPGKDRNGNETGLAIQEENLWLGRASMLLDSENAPNPDGTMPEAIDLNAWFLNEKLSSMSVPSYGGDGLKSFDRATAHKHIRDFTVENSGENAGDYDDTFLTSSGEFMRIQAWAAKEKQIVDEVMQFQALFKADSVVDKLSQGTRDYLGIKTIIRKDGSYTYE